MGLDLMNQPPPLRMRVDPDQCKDMECTYCGCKTFVQVSALRAVPILMAPPNGGHLVSSEFCCTNCMIAVDIDRSKRWAFLTEEERQKARTDMLQSMKEKHEKTRQG